MEPLWSLTHSLQLIALMPLLSGSFPPNALLFLQALSFVNGSPSLSHLSYQEKPRALPQVNRILGE